MYKLVQNMSNDELNQLISAVKLRRKEISLTAKAQLSVGDRVAFSSGGYDYKGTIKSIKQVKASVLIDNGRGRYCGTNCQVPISMMNKEV